MFQARLYYTFITKREANTIHISGRIDTSSAQILHQALHSAISDTNTLILDFHNVSYISSSGLRGLLIAKKRLGKNCLLLPCAGHEP
ncbi:MAG: STAS domain-containing protein [Synergistaceae bacterium]|nr:STAS domain-containing protein [Synergistaceae bacterium]